MKIINVYKNILFSVLMATIVVSVSSCYNRAELEVDYSDYRRIIGKEGGEINFYDYRPDSTERVIVNMNFPEGALDSSVVFNMYEYYNPSTFSDVYYSPIGFLEQSKYLYFIPYPESLGYIPYTYEDFQDSTFVTNKHYSIVFNESVKVTYYVNDFGFADTLKLFRIKIPAEDEWDSTGIENVWIKLNQQLYPDGYKDQDLFYLITGRWTDTDMRGSGEVSKYNWEEILINPLTDLDYENRTVTFEIDGTDWIYILGYKNEYYTK